MGRHYVLCVAEVQARYSTGVPYRLVIVWRGLVYLDGGGKQVSGKKSDKAKDLVLIWLSRLSTVRR